MRSRRLDLEGGPARPALFFVLALGASAVFPGAATADWLVMTDGTRVETAGPWEVRGRMLVFHDTAGNLSSIRASNVHLEASRQLTEAIARQRAAEARRPQETKRESVLRITDDDVSHVDPGATLSPPSGADAADSDTVDDAESLAVSSWDRDYDDEGSILIRGTLRNGESVPVRSASIYVILRGDDGQMIGRSRAQLDRLYLEPSQQTGFVALFPGVADFATVDFRVDATRPTPAAPAAGETPTDDLDGDGSGDDSDDDSAPPSR